MLQSMRPKKHQGDHSKEVDSLEYPLGTVGPTHQHPSILYNVEGLTWKLRTKVDTC
jgi:hypothetical protein